MNTKQLAVLVLALTLLPIVALAQDTPKEQAEPTPRDVLKEQAEAIRPMMQTKFVAQMLDAVKALPAIEPRTIYYDAANKKAYTEAAAREVDEAARESFKKLELGEQFYYFTRYGTPLASARAFDLAARASSNLNEVRGTHIADFGYGTIGQLRLLASQGAHVTGIEVDPILETLYADELGEVPHIDPSSGAAPGSIKLITGNWPADASIKQAVGEGYDLFISKNTLKRGYIHPEREVDPRMLVHLEVDDATYVQAMYDMLKPGGVAIIYNICPKRSEPDEPYIPWSDGRCPFERDLLEKAGFTVLKFDEDDTEFCRTMARAFGWDESMDLENDLFAHYTLLRKAKE